MTQSSGGKELGSGPGPGDLRTVAVGNIGIIDVVHDERGRGHAADECGDVQLFPANLKPALEVLAHDLTSARWDAQMFGKGVREEKHVGRRGKEHRTAGGQSVPHSQGHCCSTQRVADQPVNRADRITHVA
jgi:hypothetical protein